MSVSPDQLGEIFRSLRQTFHDHPAISIRPIKGDPPEQYEIVYTISGYCKTGRSDVSKAEEHRIELTIPFGFPHFPPSCKPKTDIFHPDFDPAAVCLGEFWQPGREVAELVIHLGRLINGEVYSTANAFNEEAAKWYLEHSHDFPLAVIAWGANTPSTSGSSAPTIPQIDTIEEEDLASDFDFLSLEKTVEASSATPPPAEETAPGVGEDLAYLELLRSRKKFFKLKQLLTSTPPASPESEKLLALATEQIGKAEELHQDAKKVEEAGNAKNASRMFLEVGAMVSDFPNLDQDQRRVEASLTLAREEAAAQVGQFDEQPTDDWQAAETVTTSQPTATEKVTPAKKARSTVAVKGGGLLTVKTVALLIGGGIVLLVAGYFGISWQGSRQLQQAASDLAACSTALESNNFEEAKRACESAQQNVTPRFGLHRSESQVLAEKITKVLSSEQLRQGLAGNILVNGKYLPKNEALAQENFNRLYKEAEALFAQRQWTEAENHYGKLLTLANKNTANAQSLQEIKDKLNTLRFAKAFATGNSLVAEGKWQEATTALQKAKGLLESLPEDEKRQHEGELHAALAKCSFEEFRQLGDDFFSKADWNQAIVTYKAALPAAENNKLTSPQTLQELRENITRAELYAAIDAGNKAFTAANWEEAILEYNKAGNILSAQGELVKTVDAPFTRRKIDRIILQTKVIKARQTAQRAENEDNDPVAARNIYRQLVTTLNNSGLGAEEEFAEIKKASLVAIDSLEKKIYLADKEKYLKDNYRNLFQQNYPAAVAENLSNPQIAFVREDQGRLIFKMQCQETGQGRPLTLVMFYAYEKNGNRWEFHSEQQ